MIQAATQSAYKVSGMPSAEYHARPEWSRSQVTLLPDQPEQFHGEHIVRLPAFQTKQTDDMWLGECLHAIHLEGRQIVEIPDDVLTSNGQRRGKAWEQWKEEHAGELVLLAKDAERIRAMSDGLMADPKCAAILRAAGPTEQSYFWQDPSTGLMLRARVDKLAEFGAARVLADIKATSIDVADPRQIAAKVLQFRYHQQIPWYADGVEAVEGEAPSGGGFLFVRNKPPYTARFWRLADGDVEFGRRRNDLAKADLVRRMDANDWTGATAGKENEIVLPRYAYRGDTGGGAGIWEEFLQFNGENSES